MDSDELKFILKQGEGLTFEFKERFTSKIDEDIVAFANTRGGAMLLGVDDKGGITGEKLTNELRGRILSLARNCKPAINVSISQVSGAIVVEVPEGDEKPYSCGNGYFRRLDGATQKMNHDELRMMFVQNELMPFEERPSQISFKDISGGKVRTFLREAHLPKMPLRSLLTSLKLYSGDKVNNAGVMFFAKNPHSAILQCQMSCIAFKGTEQMDIYDRMDVKDDLLSQFNTAIFFLKKHLNLISTIKGVNRVDEYDIPLDALREAVANALMHRDYSVRGTDLTIHVFDDRVEITNPSRLPAGTDPKTLEGVSMRTNEIIADMFFRMDKAEKAGTGIMKMREICQKAGVSAPEIRPGPFYKVVFRRPAKVSVKDTVRDTVRDTVKLSAKQVVIMRLVEQDSHITADAIATKIGINLRNTKKNISKLQEKGLLKRIGPDKGGHWEILRK